MKDAYRFWVTIFRIIFIWWIPGMLPGFIAYFYSENIDLSMFIGLFSVICLAPSQIWALIKCHQNGE